MIIAVERHCASNQHTCMVHLRSRRVRLRNAGTSENATPLLMTRLKDKRRLAEKAVTKVNDKPRQKSYRNHNHFRTERGDDSSKISIMSRRHDTIRCIEASLRETLAKAKESGPPDPGLRGMIPHPQFFRISNAAWCFSARRSPRKCNNFYTLENDRLNIFYV